MVSFNKTHSLLLGAGFLLGTLGVKAVQSNFARDLAVKGVAAGMRVKSGYEDIVEQAKAEVDDIVAEASYLNENDDADASEGDACSCSCGCSDDAKAADKAEAKAE